MRIQMKQTQEKQNQLAQCLEQQLTEVLIPIKPPFIFLGN